MNETLNILQQHLNQYTLLELQDAFDFAENAGYVSDEELGNNPGEAIAFIDGYLQGLKESKFHQKEIVQLTKEEASQLFENNFNCYADAETVEMAMTKEKFLEILKDKLWK